MLSRADPWVRILMKIIGLMVGIVSRTNKNPKSGEEPFLKRGKDLLFRFLLEKGFAESFDEPFLDLDCLLFLVRNPDKIGCDPPDGF